MENSKIFALVASLLVLLLATYSAAAVAVTSVVLQPAPGLNDGTDNGSAGNGMDAGFTEAQPWGRNDGSSPVMFLANSPCNIGFYPSFLRFDIAGMPTQNINSAEIQVYTQVYFNGAGWPWPMSPTISLHRVTQPWNEMAITQNSYPAYDSAAIGSRTIQTVGGNNPLPFIEFEGWITFDITDTYKAWADGSVTNNGLSFMIDNSFCTNGDGLIMYTSDYTTDASLRPKLVVNAVETSTEDTILLSPLTATNPVGSQHTVTATVQDDNGNKIVGRVVTFTDLSGPHTGLTGTGTTDANGQATFTYTGTSAGTDVIQASFVNSQGITVNSNEVTKEWIAAAAKGSISGMKFNDLNKNGVKDAVEAGLASWIITLRNGSTGAAIFNITTAADGSYKFSNLTDGNYTVGEVQQSGWTQTAPVTGKYAVTITDGSIITGKDFGNVQTSNKCDGKKHDDDKKKLDDDKKKYDDDKKKLDNDKKKLDEDIKKKADSKTIADDKKKYDDHKKKYDDHKKRHDDDDKKNKCYDDEEKD